MNIWTCYLSKNLVWYLKYLQHIVHSSYVLIILNYYSFCSYYFSDLSLTTYQTILLCLFMKNLRCLEWKFIWQIQFGYINYFHFSFKCRLKIDNCKRFWLANHYLAGPKGPALYIYFYFNTLENSLNYSLWEKNQIPMFQWACAISVWKAIGFAKWVWLELELSLLPIGRSPVQ